MRAVTSIFSSHCFLLRSVTWTAGRASRWVAISFCNLLNNGLDSSLSGRLALRGHGPAKDLSLAGVRQTSVSHKSAFSLPQRLLQLWRDEIRLLNSDLGVPLPVFMGLSDLGWPGFRHQTCLAQSLHAADVAYRPSAASSSWIE
jgi:hypothetical protein